MGVNAHWQVQVGRWDFARVGGKEYRPLAVGSAEGPQDRRYEVVATKLVVVFASAVHEAAALPCRMEQIQEGEGVSEPICPSC